MTYPEQFVRSSWEMVAMWCNWMPQGVQFCRGCSCPCCAEEAWDDYEERGPMDLEDQLDYLLEVEQK